jgi:pyruvate carboxylase
LNRLLFPGPTAEFLKSQETYGNLDQIDTVDYLYGLEQGREHVVEIAKGVRLYVGLEAIGTPDAKGFRTVMATLNGQLRPINVRDRKIAVDTVQAEKADTGNLGHVAAPFSGVVTLQTVEGAHVEVGQPIATIEAMKMEATITSNIAGVVRRLAITKTQAVEAGDLIVVVVPE